jgi:hypothetical protein
MSNEPSRREFWKSYTRTVRQPRVTIDGEQVTPVRLMIDRIDAGRVFSVVRNGHWQPILFYEFSSKNPTPLKMPVYARAVDYCRDHGVRAVLYHYRSRQAVYAAKFDDFPLAVPVIPAAAYEMPVAFRIAKEPWFEIPDHPEVIKLYDPNAHDQAEQPGFWGKA